MSAAINTVKGTRVLNGPGFFVFLFPSGLEEQHPHHRGAMDGNAKDASLSASIPDKNRGEQQPPWHRQSSWGRSDSSQETAG